MPDIELSELRDEKAKISVEHQGDISILRLQGSPHALIDPKSVTMLTRAIDGVRLQRSKVLVIHNEPHAFAPERLDKILRQVDNETDDRQSHNLIRRIRYTAIHAINLFKELDCIEIVTIRGPVDLNFFGLILAADFIIARDDFELRNRVLDQRSLTGSATPWFLAHYMGIARTKRLIMEEQSLSGQEALDLALINRLTPEEDLEAVAFAEAQRLAAKPQNTIRYLRKSYYCLHKSFSQYLKEFGPGFIEP